MKLIQFFLTQGPIFENCCEPAEACSLCLGCCAKRTRKFTCSKLVSRLQWLFTVIALVLAICAFFSDRYGFGIASLIFFVVVPFGELLL